MDHDSTNVQTNQLAFAHTPLPHTLFGRQSTQQIPMIYGRPEEMNDDDDDDGVVDYQGDDSDEEKFVIRENTRLSKTRRQGQQKIAQRAELFAHLAMVATTYIIYKCVNMKSIASSALRTFFCAVFEFV